MQTFLESELPEEFCRHLFMTFSNKGPEPGPSSSDKPRVSGECSEEVFTITNPGAVSAASWCCVVTDYCCCCWWTAGLSLVPRPHSSDSVLIWKRGCFTVFVSKQNHFGLFVSFLGPLHDNRFPARLRPLAHKADCSVAAANCLGCGSVCLQHLY